MEYHKQNVDNSYQNSVEFIKENYTKTYDDISSYKLLVFDDGYDEYHKYENKWKIFAYWKEKISLYNLKNPKIFIQSISIWKVDKK